MDNNYISTFTVRKNVLDLDKTFDCGQCFRWSRNADGSWEGIVGDKVIKIKKDTGLSNNENDIFETNISPSEIYPFYTYLDLNKDYSELYGKNLTNLEIDMIKFGEGIRILKQDAFETLISFIISQRNNIPKIKTTIEKLCEAEGTPIIYKDGSENKTKMMFPTAEQIVEYGIETLRECGLGYRAEYVFSAAESICMNPKLLENYKSSNISTNNLINNLQNFYGVGPKVANCVALFGFNRLDSFPIDVWIARIADTYYNGDIEYERYGKLAGLMQQYMFYYIKNH